MIVPRFARITSMSADVVRMVPFTLISISEVSAARSAAGTPRLRLTITPALFINTSRLGKRAFTSALSAATLAASDTSLAIVWSLGCCDLTSASRDLRRPVMMTSLPSARNLVAKARPIPALPPVTRMVWPDSFMRSLLIAGSWVDVDRSSFAFRWGSTARSGAGSACRIACHEDPRRAVDHHRPLAGEAREGGTNRGRGAGADVVGLISERTRQRAALERHLHRVGDRRVPPTPNGTEASKGAIAISVKPAAVKMRATRPRSPNENGPGASGSGGAVG